MQRLTWVSAFALAIIAVALLGGSHPTHAENERVITLYHDGIEQTIVTDAKTVSEALDRAHVTLNKDDTAEPGPDTVLVAPAYSINVYRARPVVIIDGLQRYTVMTSHTSAREIVQAAGLPYYDEDTYTLDRIDDFVTDGGVGLKLTIHRATLMNLVLYGQATQMRTQAKTVGELMQQKKIVLSGQDGMSADPNTPITAGMNLVIWRNGQQTVTQAEDIPFTTQFIRDTDHPVGYKQVQQAGQNGKKMVTYQVTMKDGKEVGRQLIQSVITQDPKQEIDVVGAQVGFTGAFQDALAKLRACEAGGNYDRNSGNGYYGAYQYDISTWGGYQGYARADLAPSDVQDQKAWLTYQRRGWAPWPACSIKLGLQDVYR